MIHYGLSLFLYKGPFSRRQTSPNVDLDTSIDTKRSSNRKDLSAPNSHRNTTPRSQEKSPVLRKEIKKRLMPPNESKVDETPKWSNNLKKFESPFREPKEKSFSLPSIEEIDGNKVDSNEMKEQSHTTIPKPESITHIEERQNFESPFKYESKLTFEVRIEKEVKATPLPRQQEVRLSVEESAREKNTLPQPVEITQNQKDFFEEENIKKAKIPESEDITPELRRDILEERIIELEAQVKEYEQTTKDLYDQLQFSNKEYEIVLSLKRIKVNLLVESRLW